MKPERNLEVEVKLRLIESPEAAIERLARHGFEMVRPRIFESNLTFDTPDQKLRQARELIRIRKVGNNVILTYKGPPQPGPHKSREEIELHVSASDQMQLILARLGYTPAFQYEKFRTEFRNRTEEGTVTLDEIPIGNYLEIEATPESIDSIAARLGYSPRDYIIQSYATLYLNYCSERGIAPTMMTFDVKPK